MFRIDDLRELAADDTRGQDSLTQRHCTRAGYKFVFRDYERMGGELIACAGKSTEDHAPSTAAAIR
jgi:hypothetical protein